MRDSNCLEHKNAFLVCMSIFATTNYDLLVKPFHQIHKRYPPELHLSKPGECKGLYCACSTSSRDNTVLSWRGRAVAGGKSGRECAISGLTLNFSSFLVFRWKRRVDCCPLWRTTGAVLGLDPRFGVLLLTVSYLSSH